jgi:hypothetical protein
MVGKKWGMKLRKTNETMPCKDKEDRDSAATIPQPS